VFESPERHHYSHILRRRFRIFVCRLLLGNLLNSNFILCGYELPRPYGSGMLLFARCRLFMAANRLAAARVKLLGRVKSSSQATDRGSICQITKQPVA
jgi:hypothetical protein